MTRKNDILVPEGYFENLQERLSSIGRTETSPAEMKVVRRIMPYIAVAASMLIAVTVGNWILSRTVVRDMQGDYESMLIAEASPLYGPDGSSFLDDELEDITNEDIVNYLISSGVSLEQINAVRYEEIY